MSDSRPDSEETRSLLERIDHGEKEALDPLLRRHRSGVRDFLESRIDPQIGARVDASDIVQDAQIDVARRIYDYLNRRPMPFHVWTRKVAFERLLKVRRAHRRECRSVEREVALPERSSLLLVGPLLAALPSPSQQIEVHEQRERLNRAVAMLCESDRELLLMRHAEHLPYEEIAYLLDIEAAAARKRYGRALIRLQELLTEFGLLDESS